MHQNCSRKFQLKPNVYLSCRNNVHHHSTIDFVGPAAKMDFDSEINTKNNEPHIIRDI